ncbi:hypothetical protein V8G54_000920 [Vigna mungo]|uniref:Transmembrane protein n=1 Tax=Vigna mungo TaxID=3915 RepID=A0AAQ3P5G0_VIGMU
MAGWTMDPRAVLVALLIILSGFQYLNQSTRYNQAIAMVKKTPAYKNKLRASKLERNEGIKNMKKSQKNTDKKVEQDLSNELDLQITRAERASVWKLLGVSFVLLPYTLGKLLLWSSYWFWRYRVKKHSYSWEDASYLTQRSLGIPLDRWRHIDEATKEDHVLKRLWEKSNMESYVAEMRKESKCRR